MLQKLFISLSLITFQALAEPLPSQPLDAANPGSAVYQYNVFFEKLRMEGRDVEVYLPAELKEQKVKAPVIVFGHGQALDSQNYRLTFEHLAKKGVAVVFPTYDNGFFDRDWDRMASDFNRLAAQTIEKHNTAMDSQRVVFAGHSKGGYIGLMAAGVSESDLKIKPSAVVVFAPAGYSDAHLRRISDGTPVTIVYSDSDTIIKLDLIQEIYAKLGVAKKQLITMVSYKGTSPELPADHFLSVSKKSLFGGRDGSSAFHFFGVWKYLLGATWDLTSGAAGTNQYLYGSEAALTGIPRLQNTITRSW